MARYSIALAALALLVGPPVATAQDPPPPAAGAERPGGTRLAEKTDAEGWRTRVTIEEAEEQVHVHVQRTDREGVTAQTEMKFPRGAIPARKLDELLADPDVNAWSRDLPPELREQLERGWYVDATQLDAITRRLRRRTDALLSPEGRRLRRELELIAESERRLRERERRVRERLRQLMGDPEPAEERAPDQRAPGAAPGAEHTTLRLRNGDRVSGSIVGRDATSVVLRTPYGDLRIDRSDILQTVRQF